MMTWINVHLPRDSDVESCRKAELMAAELAFWRNQSRLLQETLDNIYERAANGERTELWRGDVKVVVVREKGAA